MSLLVDYYFITIVDMQLGLVGLGKMGAGIARRLIEQGHDVVAYDQNDEARSQAEEDGIQVAASIEDLVHSLSSERNIWLMIPAGEPVNSTIEKLIKLIDSGDTIVDGGNSNFNDSVKRGERLAKRGVNFIDAGVSGGVAGEKTGYALMVGGEKVVVSKLETIFKSLATDEGYLHVGVIGSGHYTKMVHNAIEYGLMQAIAEGFDLLKTGPYGKEIDLAQVARMWNSGTIIRSFLMDLSARALEKDSNLEGIAGYVEDSGEGRWATEEAVNNAVPFWVNTAALYARFDSRAQDLFAAKLVAALRKEFGGHAVKKK